MKRVAFILVGIGVAAIAADRFRTRMDTPQLSDMPPGVPSSAGVLDTPHYRIYYTAEKQHAESVGEAVEKLYAAYVSVFPPPTAIGTEKLTLVLYGDRRELKKNNKSASWAEAFYLHPNCYAYFDATRASPYHWMLHEATHQLAQQVSGFKRNRWVEEGLASYFGSSRLDDSGLRLGDIDRNTYPVWGLPWYRFSGHFGTDVENWKLIPLDQLISGQGGPNVDTYFNLYYMTAWSFTHFMLHYEDGKYRQAYKQFLANGASLSSFESIIGPLDRIQDEWYGYRVAQSR